jgi:sugar phosphate isomerase/epimerase
MRIDHTAAALRMAAKLGARCITTESGGLLDPGMSREWALSTFVAGLELVLPVAEKCGVMLLVEPEPGLLIENANQFVKLAERLTSRAFGLNFDVGHFYCVGDPLPATVRRLAPWTRHYHLEDIAATRVHEHLVPGRGAIGFREVLTAVRGADYGGWLTVELYPYVHDPDGAGREALAHLAPLLDVQ